MTEFPKTPPRTPRTVRVKEEAPRIPTPGKTPKTGKKPQKKNSKVRMQTSREISEIVALIECAQKMKVMEVTEELNQQEMIELVKKRVPIVFRNLASKWKCVEDWSKPGYLKRAAEVEAETCPHRKYRQFTAHSSESGRLHLTDGKSKAVSVSMSEFLKHAQGDSQDGLYLLGIHSVHSGGLSYCPVQPHTDDKADAPLVNDVPKQIPFLDWYAALLALEQNVKDPIRYDHQQFFLAKGYAFTDLHYDSYDNFYVAVSGTRRWTLACPNASRWLVNASGGKLKSGSNAIPHMGSFEEGSAANLYPFAYVDLHPGDVLFVPTCWWHLVESKPGKDGFSSAFNFFFSKPPDDVFGEFIAQLAETDSMVNALQKECRSRIAEACLNKDDEEKEEEKIVECPKRMDTETWDQLVILAKIHHIDLEPLKAKWDSNSIEKYVRDVAAKSEDVPEIASNPTKKSSDKGTSPTKKADIAPLVKDETEVKPPVARRSARTAKATK